jgi:hypothetical protein
LLPLDGTDHVDDEGPAAEDHWSLWSRDVVGA